MQRIANPSTPVRFRPQLISELFFCQYLPKEFMKKVVVSGGFDPVHIGHLEMLKQAKKIAPI